MIRPYCLTLLIASPSDVDTERKLIEKECQNWYRKKGKDLNVTVLPVRWERDMAITSDDTAQNLVNEQLLNESDIVVAVFWTRFGSPTDHFESGTLEEIEISISKKRPVMVYFLGKKVDPGSISPEQLKKVQEFKVRYRDQGVYRDVKTTANLIDHFFTDLTYNVNKVVKEYNEQSSMSRSISIENSSREASDSHEDSSEKEKESEGDYWYELSIHNLMEEYLKRENLGFAAYRKGITFLENCNLWKSISLVTHSALVEKAKHAREFAFNMKYGKYNYSKDLRNNYQKTWYLPIHAILGETDKQESQRIIGVGANNGEELLEIFPDHKKNKLTLEVLDISSTAIEEGKSRKNDIVFHKGNMEESPLQKEVYDIYLNLRSIHSSGVDIKSTISECSMVLKPDGIAIFSVSNGYLAPTKPGSKEFFEVYGMYNSGTGHFSGERPFALATKIRRKLEEYGFRDCRINTGKTEIFISALK